MRLVRGLDLTNSFHLSQRIASCVCLTHDLWMCYWHRMIEHYVGCSSNIWSRFQIHILFDMKLDIFSQNLLSYLVLNSNESFILKLLLLNILLNIGEVSPETALGEAISWSMSSWDSLNNWRRFSLESLELLSCFWPGWSMKSHVGLRVFQIWAHDTWGLLILLVEVRILIVGL